MRYVESVSDRTAGLVDRERLLSALDGAVTKRVTLISAPAGSGKTSLLHTWIQRTTHRVAFVSARADEDEQRFWLSLLASIRGEPAETPAPSFSGAAMVDRVVAELGEHPEPVVLVMDDLHELGSHEHVAKLLSDLPQHAHAVVATRRDLRLGTHRLRLAGELAEIRAANLQFTDGETRQLLAGAGVDLSDEGVRTLLQRTEGWAAGLRLAALSLAVDPDPERFVTQFSGSDRTVADYLIAEMLERQAKDVQRLLLTTSILERVNGELGDLLAETTGFDQVLLELEDANAFVVSLDAERAWFRYHHLFRELLRLELRRTTPALIPELNRRAARWFADHGHVVDAIRHLQAAGDWHDAAELLTDNVFGLLMDGRLSSAEPLLNAFPGDGCARDPELALVHAAEEIFQGRFDEAPADLEVAQRHAKTLSPARQARVRVAIASLKLLLATRQGQLEDVVEQVSILASTDSAPSEVSFSGDLRGMALMTLGIVEMWSGRLADADRHLQEGAALARRIGRPFLEVACLANLGFASKSKSLATARRYCEQAIALAERNGWGGNHIILPALVSLGGTLIWEGDFSSGERWLRRAARLTSPDADPQVELLLHLASGMLYAAQRDRRAALEEFEAAQRMQSLTLGEHVLAAQVTGWTIATRARLGRLDEARKSLDGIARARARAGEIQNAAAVVSLEDGEPEAALSRLRDVLTGGAPVIHDFTILEAHLLAARAHQLLDDERERDAAVERALALAERDRLIFPFAMTGSRDLLDALPRHATAHAALLQELLDLLDGAPVRQSSPPAEKLSPTELRVLRYLPTNLTRPDVARELYVSVNTVHTHVRNIYSKLGVGTRSEAVERARRLGLLSGGLTPPSDH
jgi:LuxR family maltose regulon positive regulatory protein